MTLADKQAMYGDVVYTTDGRHHAYDCVQPLQGLITFTDPKDETYARDNLSLEREGRAARKNPGWLSWENVIYLMLCVKIAIGSVMFKYIDTQTAYNDIYLTNFKTVIKKEGYVTYDTYTIESAGRTNPMRCLLVALLLVIFSVIIGLISSKKYMLNVFSSWIVILMLFALQILAISLHATMHFNNGYTTISMIILHGVTLGVTLLVFIRLAWAPQSKQTKVNFDAHEKNKQKLAEFAIEYNEDIQDALHTKKRDLNHEDIYRETTSNFWLCVVEDLNTILCYAFVVRACDAQTSIHDDSTTFFDVLCIVFLGFLQHVANILMIFHAHIAKQTEIKMRGKSEHEKKSMQKQLHEIFTFIARTRLLLFFMISITVVFFYLRIAPTYEEYSEGMPYEIIRALAVITMVSLTTLHSAWFEFQSAQNPKKSWDTSPTWKLGALAFIALIFTCLIFANTLEYKDEGIRKQLHGGIPAPPTTPARARATTTSLRTSTPPPPPLSK
jgi:hypothetical protein